MDATQFTFASNVRGRLAKQYVFTANRYGPYTTTRGSETVGKKRGSRVKPNIVSEIMAVWSTLTKIEKQSWQKNVNRFQITGYNCFLKTNIHRAMQNQSTLRAQG